MKCKHNKVCNHYDKDSYSCNRYKDNDCGIFRWFEKEILRIKKINKRLKKKKRKRKNICNYI